MSTSPLIDAATISHSRYRSSPVDIVEVDSHSSLPIYRQLADQIRLLVEFGELPYGARLPSAAQLADNLDVHRNTVQKAYRDLQRQGVIVSEGSRGSYVAVESDRKEPPPRVFELLGELVREADAANIDPGELASLVQVHAARWKALRSQSVTFVECNQASLTHYQGEIERSVGIRVDPVLLEEVAGESVRAQSGLIVTTFYHFADVRRRLQAAGLTNELLAINVRPHLEVLQQLNGLKPGTRLGVVYLADDPYAEVRLRRMYDTVAHLRLTRITVAEVAVTEEAKGADFANFDAVLVRPENISRVRAHIPAGLRVIEFRNTLDDASIELLRDVVSGQPIVT